jgi:hypothetical protein
MTRQKFDRMIYFKVEPSLKEAIFRESDEKRIPASVLLREAVEMGLSEDRKKVEFVVLDTEDIKHLVESEGVLWFNNFGGAAICGICGQYYSVETGWEAFLNGTKKPICHRCRNGTTIERAIEILREHDKEFWVEFCGMKDEEKGKGEER